MALLAPDRIATGADIRTPDETLPRRFEQVAEALRQRGVGAASVRLPPTTHGVGDHGFVAMLTARARKTGVPAFIGGGGNR